MKYILMATLLVVFSFGKEKKISEKVQAEIREIQKHLEKLEKDLKEEAKAKKDSAEESLDEAGQEAKGLVKKGLNGVADGLKALEQKVREMAKD